MRKHKCPPNYRRKVLRLPDLDHSKLAVLVLLGTSPGFQPHRGRALPHALGIPRFGGEHDQSEPDIAGFAPRLRVRAWHRSKNFFHGFRSRAQLLLPNYFASFVQHAVPSRSITQVQTDRQPLIDILLARCRHSAILLHCRSPLSVCASSASITWERTASRPETGLLIPSVRASYPRTEDRPSG